jgi:hypothetical protein
MLTKLHHERNPTKKQKTSSCTGQELVKKSFSNLSATATITSTRTAVGKCRATAEASVAKVGLC